MIGALAGCEPSDEGNAGGGNAVEEPVVNLPTVAITTPPMDRETLLLAVVQAASAHASGIDDRDAQRELDGQRFQFAVRFGCEGQAEDLRSASLGWSYQLDNQTLRLRATPTIKADDPLAAMIGGDLVEAIEGFWVPRPWMLRSTCPVSKLPPASVEGIAKGDRSLAPQVQSMRWPKVGIAQFFTSGDTRTSRRDGRAYEAFKPVTTGAQVGEQGFNLILAGRLRPVPGKRVIECYAAAGDAPPDCIVSAHIDEVRMEQPADNDVLARWSG